MKKTHIVLAVMAALFFAVLAIVFFVATLFRGNFQPMAFIGAFALAFLPGLAAYSVTKALVEQYRAFARIAELKARRRYRVY